MAKANKKPVKSANRKAEAAKAPAGKSKKHVKSGVKPAKKAGKPAPAKVAKGAKAPAPKAGHAQVASKAVGKLLRPSDSDAKAQKVEAAANKAGKKIAPVKKKKDKKEKKGKEGFVLEEDDLLASDEEIGSEEIPDLSEFDEAELEAEELEPAEEEADGAGASALEVRSGDDEVVLTDAEGRRYCRVRDCDQISAVEAYCRFHYLLLWKRIQVRRRILADGKLERYVDELTSRYPDKFLEMIQYNVM